MGTKYAAIAILLFSGLTVSRLPQQSKSNEPNPGSEVCSSCHAEISQSYARTAMAGASGPAADGLLTGEFHDNTSGVTYRVYKRDGRVWMSYEREGANDVHGERELLYYIGSGRKGRTYLFSDDGYLFETPINWYSQEQRWNMAPAYLEAKEIPMNLPSYSSCLNCHTSDLQPRIRGTRNRFSGVPFLHDGITCERCHGAGSEHFTNGGPIVNPASLPAEKRDAICMECHFEGTVAITQPDKKLENFKPGENLSDYIHYFLLRDDQPQKAEALSQFEALSFSKCKQKSGDRMWCGSCHDPHVQPKDAERAAYYRAKCVACHGDRFAAKHHPNNPDCVSCHMPTLPSKDVAHTQSTDHRILKNPTQAPLQKIVGGLQLSAFPQNAAQLVTTRDLALGWEQLAHRGVDGASHQAQTYLDRALQQLPDDPSLLSALAFEQQEHGREKDAQQLYEHTLIVRPTSSTAATNLGILEAEKGDIQHAVQLWQGAFQRVPYKSEIGLDLAIVFCTAGQKDEARHYVERVLEFNPDYGKARQLLSNLGRTPVKCSP